MAPYTHGNSYTVVIAYGLTLDIKVWDTGGERFCVSELKPYLTYQSQWMAPQSGKSRRKTHILFRIVGLTIRRTQTETAKFTYGLLEGGGAEWEIFIFHDKHKDFIFFYFHVVLYHS